MSNIPCNYCHHKDDAKENGCDIYCHKFKCEKYSAYLDGREDAIQPFNELYKSNICIDHDLPTMSMLMNFYNQFKEILNEQI